MKVFFKTLSLALVVALAGTVGDVQAVTSTTEIAQTQKAANNKPIPLALPDTVDVVLKNTSSVTGKVTAFDSKGQTIQISRNSDSRSLQIAQIQQVTFRRGSLVYRSDGRLVIRGDDHAHAKQSTWSGIPLNAFQLVDSKLGQANVDLATVMNQQRLRSIRSVAVKSLYVADEIQFEPTGKMTIKVTPTDP
ncbi:hypothetical protein I8752_23030 [Nostocaceae cyanobacterium CENA369]|uniref:DUF5666 domain-containing protein n=1 Tax=Dendronalium phyllosphericum CENA369 TaxID=1725256 RepID=A0A8J7I4U2_9NOST|nr:hypothetical protein [Dendronalium phyllosphericum]MBH8575821.1 hypothetical protein [Dendronalium phyllosphericum CENA369]